MDTDPNVSWVLAGELGIEIDGGKGVWHTGCARDVLVTPSGEVMVASDTGGVWSVTAAPGTSLACGPTATGADQVGPAVTGGR